MDELLRNSLIKRIEQAELFSKRFGSFNKSDFEVLMFTAYLDSIEGELRDYEISIDLGIPESKVRTLRVKSQLQYPREIKWIDVLAVAIKNGSYDKNSRMITISIEDPSARNRIRYEVEKQFGMVTLSLNSKHLTLPIESFVLLATSAETEMERVVEALNKQLKKRDAAVKKIEKQDTKTRFLAGVSNIGSFLNDIAPFYEMGLPVIKALMTFFV